MRTLATAGLLLLTLSAAAQKTTPCAGGTMPTFSVTGTNPVLLTFEHLTTHAMTNPNVSIEGTVITVTQTYRDIPPPPAMAALFCNSQTVSLGALLPGREYTVRWSYGVPSPLPGRGFLPHETFTFAFAHHDVSVPALDGPALAALMLLLGTVGVMLLRR